MKGPKGFAVSGKASAAGKKAMIKRWGARYSPTLHILYLPSQEKAILEAADRLFTGNRDPYIRVRVFKKPGEAIDWLVKKVLCEEPRLRSLSIFCDDLFREKDLEKIPLDTHLALHTGLRQAPRSGCGMSRPTSSSLRIETVHIKIRAGCV